MREGRDKCAVGSSRENPPRNTTRDVLSTSPALEDRQSSEKIISDVPQPGMANIQSIRPRLSVRCP